METTQPRYIRKVIRITAKDSPNVKVGLLCQRAGIKPTDEMVVDGVLSWEEYQKRLQTWDDFQITVGLNAQFYRGKELMLYPSDRLEAAALLAEKLKGKKRRAKSLGIDTAEGGDSTVWTTADEYGFIKQIVQKTPDTDVIPGRTVAFGKMYDIPPERWLFDRGGGGKQHADRLRAEGYDCITVGFGEAVLPEPGEAGYTIQDKVEDKEQRYVCVNRRTQMYVVLSQLLEGEFAIPAEFAELHRQLSKIPKIWDTEGRLKMLPKRSKGNSPSLIKLLGKSPDEADSAVLSSFGLYMGEWQPSVEVLTF